MNPETLLTPIIQAASRSNRINAGDYEQDGILFCGKCHTAKQTVIPMGGEQIKVLCLCDCASEAYEQERLEEAARKKRAEIERLRISGLNDSAIRQITFSFDDGRGEKLAEAKRYVAKWDKMYRQNIGLLMWGNTGNGKTFAAACIANALIDEGVPVLMTGFAKLLNALTGLYPGERIEYLDSLKHYPLLILDDLGAERDTSFALEQVYAVIDARYKQHKPLIVTTNMTLAEMQKPKNMDYQRIYDRVLEMCVPLHFKGDSRRKDKAAEKLKQALKELTDE